MIISKRGCYCKECKHFVGGGKINQFLGLCVLNVWQTKSVKENDFCSYGKRKDKNNNEK